jgi:hypothetical protein
MCDGDFGTGTFCSRSESDRVNMLITLSWWALQHVFKRMPVRRNKPQHRTLCPHTFRSKTKMPKKWIAFIRAYQKSQGDRVHIEQWPPHLRHMWLDQSLCEKLVLYELDVLCGRSKDALWHCRLEDEGEKKRICQAVVVAYASLEF